jgi:hypothetical protein
VLVIVGPLFRHVVGNTNSALCEVRRSTRHCRTLRPNPSITLGTRVASMLLAGGSVLQARMMIATIRTMRERWGTRPFK